MADQPDVLKRLEEIEARSLPPARDTIYLLRLTRALLESQMEIIETGRKATNCGHERPVLGCLDRLCWMLARAEKVRKGEV